MSWGQRDQCTEHTPQSRHQQGDKPDVVQGNLGGMRTCGVGVWHTHGHKRAKSHRSAKQQDTGEVDVGVAGKHPPVHFGVLRVDRRPQRQRDRDTSSGLPHNHVRSKALSV